jgi:predicted kinase
MKTLVMMVGLPRSGKTTRADALYPSVPKVSPDAVRLALHGQPYISEAEPFVWAIARTMVKALFLAGHDIVVLDACNNTRARRDEWKSWSWDREFIRVGTNAEECRARVKKSLPTQPAGVALVAAIDRMEAAHEPVSDDELAYENER